MLSTDLLCDKMMFCNSGQYCIAYNYSLASGYFYRIYYVVGGLLESTCWSCAGICSRCWWATLAWRLQLATSWPTSSIRICEHLEFQSFGFISWLIKCKKMISVVSGRHIDFNKIRGVSLRRFPIILKKTTRTPALTKIIMNCFPCSSPLNIVTLTNILFMHNIAVLVLIHLLHWRTKHLPL